MSGLNERQIAALKTIADSPNKSGRFYADLGHKAVTISSLWYRKLIETGNDYSVIGAPIYGVTWTLTDAGRAALSESKEQAR